MTTKHEFKILMQRMSMMTVDDLFNHHSMTSMKLGSFLFHLISSIILDQILVKKRVYKQSSGSSSFSSFKNGKFLEFISLFEASW